MELVKEVARNANAGIDAIDSIKTCIKDEKLLNLMLEQRARLCDIKDRAVSEIRCDCDGAELHPAEKAMFKGMVKMKASLDKSNNNIAEMLIEGNNMGINDIVSVSHKADCGCGCRQNTPLVGELIEAYDVNIKELRQFL